MRFDTPSLAKIGLTRLLIAMFPLIRGWYRSRRHPLFRIKPREQDELHDPGGK